MSYRLSGVVAFAAAATLAIPARVHAAPPPVDCSAGIGATQLGFGGFFSGCWAGFQVTSYFENAEDVSNMYWFNGLPTRNTAGTNNPISAPGTFLFDNDCGHAVSVIADIPIEEVARYALELLAPAGQDAI